MPKVALTEKEKLDRVADHQIRSDRAKQMWAKRRAREFTGAPHVAVTPTPSPAPLPAPVVVAIPSTTGNKWEDLPLEQAIGQLAKLELEIQKARQVIVRRQQSIPVILKCWVALHHNEKIDNISRAYAQCRKQIPDGRWVMRDDGPRNSETGLVEPAVMCSIICYNVYMAHTAKVKISRTPQERN